MNSSEYLLKTSRDYALYVCQTRGIPQVSDGLKHVQRMALWLLRHRAEKIKTLALGGLLAVERIYVHGDVSANDAIGDLAAPFKNNFPLIEGLGHFGSKKSPGAIGAPRYTEVRRAKVAEAILYPDLDIIPLEDNYDGSTQQPQHFLPLIPMVLLNGVSGIAVGWSTAILPRDLRALIDATKAVLLDRPMKPLPPCYTQYDITVNNIGLNRWEFIGRARIINTSTIHVTELPPGMTIEAFRKRLIAMEDADLIQGFTDRSTEAIDITIKVKRGTGISDWSEQTLIDFLKLRERVTERIVVIDWNGISIRTYDDPEALVRDFVAWRLSWYAVRYRHYKARDEYELRYWLALKILFERNFPKRLGTFTDKVSLRRDADQTLRDADLILDDSQLDRVINLPTYRWTREFEAEIDSRIADLRALIAGYDGLLASPEKQKAVYVQELDALKSLK